MSGAEILGLVAGAFVTCSLVPQVLRVFKLKSAREISMLFTTLLWIGMFIWIGYGVVLRLVPVIVWNAIGASIVATLLYAKLRYGR